uniref:Mobile element protein n=1 Tax=Klebsiella pneumoniae TaxID=573 RepID=A0A6G9HME6_KLEPN|nr:Mobile element protein [Klebsiella pneumoniae]
MNPFKGRHFQRDIILWAVRWYCKYGISYRELQEMLAERGVNVDHSTIYRWVQRYAPEMEKRLRWYWRNPSDLCPWHMDETYVKVNGRWAYLYRAVDSRGRTVDFYLSSRRNSKAAYRFLGKILNNVKKWQIPRFINTDKAPAYGRALALLKREGRCPSDVEHRQIKKPVCSFAVTTGGEIKIDSAAPAVDGPVQIRPAAIDLHVGFIHVPRAKIVIKISRIWADFFPANTSNQPI